MEQRLTASFERWLPVLIAVLLLVGLYQISLENYILFHTIAELFSIVVAFSMFLFAWNSRRFSGSSYLVFLGIAYLSIAAIDTVHTLAYKGMAVFPDRSANLPTQLWIAARYTQSISLLISPIFLRRRVHASWFVVGYALVTGGLLASIFYWDVFPTCYVDGQGMTTFKIYSEYVIAAILLAAAAFLWRSRAWIDPMVLKLMTGAIFVTILSELAFTKYIGVYDLANLVGHFTKIVAFYLVYRAILQTGFVAPYNLLFRDLRNAEQRYQALFEHSSSGLALFRIPQEDKQIEILETNLAFERFLGLERGQVAGKPLSSLPLASNPELIGRAFQEVLTTKTPIRMEQNAHKLGRVFSVAVFSPGESQIAVALDDITEQKRTQERERELIAVQERERIARDLHDAVSQTLFSVNVLAEALPRLWKRNPAAAEAQLMRLHEHTRCAMTEMRILLLELRPASLLQVDLPTLLKQLCEALHSRKRILFDSNVTKDFDLPPDVKLGFYRVAQEALNNVVKHSQATETCVTLCNKEHELVLGVSDNGRGFDIKSVAATSLGLEIMRERATDIGAVLSIDTAPDQGAHILLSWAADLRRIQLGAPLPNVGIEKAGNGPKP